MTRAALHSQVVAALSSLDADKQLVPKIRKGSSNGSYDDDCRLDRHLLHGYAFNPRLRNLLESITGDYVLG